MVEDVVDYCAGLDVHRDTVVATVRFPEGNRRCSVTKTFGTDTAELERLRRENAELRLDREFLKKVVMVADGVHQVR